MIRICTAFPPEWPPAYRDEFASAFAQHWTKGLELVAPAAPEGRNLDNLRLIVPAAMADDTPDGEIIAWLDPDVRALSAMPSYVIPQLLAGADICFIGTDAGEADLAFWAAWLSPAVRSFLIRVASASAEGSIGPEVWRAEIERAGLMARDLTPGGLAAWAQGPLGRYSCRVPRP